MTTPNNGNNSFGKWLKQTRNAQRLTQDNLAMRVGCAFETIRKLEAGTRKPSRQMAELIGRALNVPEHDMPELIKQATGGKDSAQAPGSTEARVAEALGGDAPKQEFELPWPLNSEFVGREQEVAAIRALFLRSDVRLLTMVGAGGIGKTRLALEVARACKDSFASGPFVVLLSTISNPDLFMSSVAVGLDLLGATGPGEVSNLQEAVYNYLRGRQAMMVIDNMEHLLACAPQVTALLKNCPQLKILVTSREPLHVSGEKQYPVPPLTNAPLEIPEKRTEENGADQYTGKTAGETFYTASYYSKYEAVQLFVKRAQDIDPGFRLTDENAGYVARICWELDGLPLAIELAASQSKTLTPKALYKRITKQLRLTMRGTNDLPDRQRTLRGAIDWSYGLLNEQERRLFRRLGVFEVGHTLDAIEAICFLPGERAFDAYHVIRSLTDKSLIGREIDEEGEPRFFMLWTTREYAMERLDESEETEAVRRKHAAYYATLAENAAPELTSPRRSIWLSRLDAEIYNMRSAMEWALIPDAGHAPGSFEANKKAEVGLRIAGALHWFWYLRGRISEGREWLGRTLAATHAIQEDTGSISARAAALDTAGRLAFMQGEETGIVDLLTESLELWRQTKHKRGLAYALTDLGVTIAYFRREKASNSTALLEEAIELFKQLDDKWGLAYALDFMGDNMALTGKGDEESARYKQKSLILYRDMDDRWGIASLLSELGYNAIKRGDYQVARKMLEEALAMSQKVGDKRYIAFATAALAEVTWYMGNPIKARNQYSDSLILYRELGDRRGEANTLRNLGHLAHREGDERQASHFYRQSLRIERELGSEPNMALLLGALAGLVGALGKPKQAARLLGTADTAFKTAGGIIPPIDRIQRKYTYETLRSLLGEARFEEEMTFGTTISLETGLQLINFDLPQ